MVGGGLVVVQGFRRVVVEAVDVVVELNVASKIWFCYKCYDRHQSKLKLENDASLHLLI